MIRSCILLLLLCSTLGPSSGLAMDCPLLIVASPDVAVDHLSRREVRRLYLGIPYRTRNGLLQPARNTSDRLIQEVFLQKILAMTETLYQRLLAMHLVRLRQPGPVTIDDPHRLIELLRDRPDLVSYLWASDLPPGNTLKVLLEVPCENN